MVRERLAIIGAPVCDVTAEIIGVDAIDRTGTGGTPREVRARVVGRAATRAAAEQIGAEVEALYTNGPFGGGGVTRSVRKIVAVASTLIPAKLAQPRIILVEA